jgi:hypothetical protein
LKKNKIYSLNKHGSIYSDDDEKNIHHSKFELPVFPAAFPIDFCTATSAAVEKI